VAFKVIQGHQGHKRAVTKAHDALQTPDGPSWLQQVALMLMELETRHYVWSEVLQPASSNS